MKQVYLFYGEETYLRQEAVKAVCSQFVSDPDDLNYLSLDTDTADETKIINFASTMPFCANYRVVVIKNSGFLKQGGAMLANFLQNMPDTAILIFSENTVDKRSKLYRVIQKMGEEQCEIKEFVFCKEYELVNRIMNFFHCSGIDIDRKDAQYLVSRTDGSVSQLLNEANKLVNYINSPVVTKTDIDAVCIRTLENRIFEMIDASISGKTDTALALYSDLLALKEPPGRILYLITSQYDKMYRVKQGDTEGIHPYAVKKIASLAKNMDKDFLKRKVEECITLETLFKTGRMNDRMAVELLLAGGSI